MTFKEYFNSLLIPLKATSNVFISIFESIAESFDLLKSYSILIVEKFFVSADVDEFAKERSVTRILNESDSSFNTRVLNAYKFLTTSPTKIGLQNILSSVIDKEFEIRELYTENFILDDANERLEETAILSGDEASFYFIVEFAVPLTVAEKDYLESIIDLYKPAHVGYHIGATILDDFILDDTNEQLEINTYLE